MNITLLVKSSSGGFYEMQFLTNEKGMRVFCHCPAGKVQQVCKHKLSILRGEDRLLLNPEQQPLFEEIIRHQTFPALSKMRAEYDEAILYLEKQKAILSNGEKEIKSAFSKVLTFGP